MFKKCSKCKKELKLCSDIFHRDRSKKSGFASRCKDCVKKYRNRTVDKDYNKKYRESNRNYYREYRKTYKRDSKKYNKYKSQFSTYDTFKHKLTPDEDPRADGKYLEVKCTYCGRYFKPTNQSVHNRISSLNGNMRGESRLYCSDGCKAECSIYNSRGGRTNTKLARESNPILRQEVLKRDEYEFQKCGSKDNLHCHHIAPVKVDPGKSEDPDNCITFCRKCHYEIHEIVDGCGLGDLRKLEDKC